MKKKEIIDRILEGWLAKAKIINDFCKAENLRPYATKDDIKDLMEALEELPYRKVKAIYLHLRSLVKTVEVEPYNKSKLSFGFEGCPFCLLRRHNPKNPADDPICAGCPYGRRHGICPEDDSDFNLIYERLEKRRRKREVMERILEAWIGALKVKNFKRRSGS